MYLQRPYLSDNYLSLIDAKPNQVTDTSSFILALLSLHLSLIMLPLLSIFIQYSDESYLKSEKVKKMIGSFYKNLKIYSKQSLFYNVIFMIRRILIGVYATQLQKYPGIQI